MQAAEDSVQGPLASTLRTAALDVHPGEVLEAKTWQEGDAEQEVVFDEAEDAFERNEFDDGLLHLTTGTSDGSTWQWTLDPELLKAQSTRPEPDVPNELEKLDAGTPEEFDLGARKAWPNGVDNRIALSLSDMPDDANPFRYIGTFGGCTATAVGRNGTSGWILTAAHCLYDGDTGAVRVAGKRFRPRRDGRRSPWGSFFTASSRGYVVPSGFTSNGCHKKTKFGKTCVANDIALVQVFDSDGATWPGEMHVAALSKSILKDNWLVNVGYPGCSAKDAPSPCVKDRAYASSGTATDFGKKASGEYRRFRSGHATSPGHSGGPVYVWRNNAPRVVGVASASSRCTEGCRARPAHMRKVTSNWTAFLDAL